MEHHVSKHRQHPTFFSTRRPSSVSFRLKFGALLLALIPALSGTHRGLLIPGLKISDVLILMLAVYVFVTLEARWQVLDSLGIAVCFYAIVFVLVTLLNFAERIDLDSSILLKELFAVPQYALLYLLAFAIGQRLDTLMLWLKYSLAFALLISIIAILQLFDIGQLREILATVTGNDRLDQPLDWKIYRATGLFPGQHALGAYLSIHLIMAVALVTRQDMSKSSRAKLLITISVVGFGLLTTLTATPILLAAIGSLYLMLKHAGSKYLFWFGSIALIVSWFSPIRELFADRIAEQSVRNVETDFTFLPQTIAYRFMVWERDFMPVIKENWFNGYGPSGRADEGMFAYSESMYIRLLLDGGILLLAAFLVFMMLAIRRMIQVQKISYEDEHGVQLARLGNALVFTLLGLLVIQIIHPYMKDAGVASLVFVSLGLLSGKWTATQRSQRDRLLTSHQNDLIHQQPSP